MASDKRKFAKYLWNYLIEGMNNLTEGKEPEATLNQTYVTDSWASHANGAWDATTLDDFWAGNKISLAVENTGYGSWYLFDWAEGESVPEEYGKRSLIRILQEAANELGSALTKKQLYLLGCCLSLYVPMVKRASEIAQGDVNDENERLRKENADLRERLEAVYLKLPLAEGEVTETGAEVIASAEYGGSACGRYSVRNDEVAHFTIADYCKLSEAYAHVRLELNQRHRKIDLRRAALEKLLKDFQSDQESLEAIRHNIDNNQHAE